jgi:hypothetical protein
VKNPGPSRRILAWLIAVAFLRVASPAGWAGKQPVEFNRDIRPIFTENCFACHGPDPGTRKANLRLDRAEDLFATRKGGTPVVKGNPKGSRLFQRITTKDPDDLMPPPKSHKTLDARQIEMVRNWITEGAPWQAHWSFIAPKRPSLPAVKTRGWVRNPIDYFVLSRLESHDLKPAPEADRAVLLRRLSLDLTGLPPEPAEVEAFLQDDSEGAYEKAVDRLLDSPHYGEHRAHYWLDAARYGDTHGLHFDNYREIWAFRDWVIDAFNLNEPFDQFTVDQLAGDLLPHPTQEQLVATGFHRCGITTAEGGTIENENLANYARDRVETTSWVWLGLTANCAVCHDHKFDPIPTKDFYSMSAYFRNTTQSHSDNNAKDPAPIIYLAKDPHDAERLAAIPKELEGANAAATKRASEVNTLAAAAKAGDLESRIDRNALVLQLPLNDETGGPTGSNCVPADARCEASSEFTWQAGGRYGPAPELATDVSFDLGKIGDFDKETPFSFGCWVKLLPFFNSSGAIVAKMEGGARHRGWDLFISTNDISVHLVSQWPDNAIEATTYDHPLKVNEWRHLFVSYNGSGRAEGVSLFIDGRQVGLRNDKNNLTNSIRNEVPLRLGQRESGDHFDEGSVQDIRVFGRLLGAPEIENLAKLPALRLTLEKDPTKRSGQETAEVSGFFLRSDSEYDTCTKKTSALNSELATLHQRLPTTLVQDERPNVAATAQVLMRGQYDKPGETVSPGVFSALHPLPEGAPTNRLGLAQWLVAADNPLTARVTVNRFWQEIFGVGIVKTTEDFGIMGEAPTHPELLDWLAVEFRESGWDMKKILRLMVTSATYRQSSAVTPDKLARDPANRLLSRGPRFRMDAEMIRDLALSASGLLGSRVGGPSVKPYQPDGVWNISLDTSNTKTYARDSGESLYRRSLYTFWKRMAPPSSMEIFNAPSRETCTVRRERTDTPMQALATLNDPQFVEAAKRLAEGAIKRGGETEDGRIGWMGERLIARRFKPEEVKLVEESLHDLRAFYQAKPADAVLLLASGESRTDPTLNPVDLAAWTMVANELMNLDEVLNK